MERPGMDDNEHRHLRDSSEALCENLLERKEEVEALGSTIGMEVINWVTGEVVVSYNADREFPAASTIKVATAYAYGRILGDNFDADTSVKIPASMRLPGIGAFDKKRGPVQLPAKGVVADLFVDALGGNSGNTAFKRLAQLAGRVEAMNKALQEAGLTGTYLQKGQKEGEIRTGITTASDYSRLMAALVVEAELGDPVAKLIIGSMQNNQTRQGVRHYYPLNSQRVIIAGKTGRVNDILDDGQHFVRHDTGAMIGENRLIYSIFTDSPSREGAEAAEQLIGKMGIDMLAFFGEAPMEVRQGLARKAMGRLLHGS